MILIGEKINGTRKKVGEAITVKDDQFITELAQKQFDAGATYLDVNADTLPDREPKTWLGLFGWLRRPLLRR